MTALERLGLAFAVLILAGGVFFTPRLVSGSQPGSALAPLTTDVNLAADRRESDDDRDEPDPGASGFVDLYGNEVTDAIATYTFDQAGSLYELHSPQTELPRLGIPKGQAPTPACRL